MDHGVSAKLNTTKYLEEREKKSLWPWIRQRFLRYKTKKYDP